MDSSNMNLDDNFFDFLDKSSDSINPLILPSELEDIFRPSIPNDFSNENLKLRQENLELRKRSIEQESLLANYELKLSQKMTEHLEMKKQTEEWKKSLESYECAVSALKLNIEQLQAENYQYKNLKLLNSVESIDNMKKEISNKTNSVAKLKAQLVTQRRNFSENKKLCDGLMKHAACLWDHLIDIGDVLSQVGLLKGTKIRILEKEFIDNCMILGEIKLKDGRDILEVLNAIPGVSEEKWDHTMQRILCDATSLHNSSTKQQEALQKPIVSSSVPSPPLTSPSSCVSSPAVMEEDSSSHLPSIKPDMCEEKLKRKVSSEASEKSQKDSNSNRVLEEVKSPEKLRDCAPLMEEDRVNFSNDSNNKNSTITEPIESSAICNASMSKISENCPEASKTTVDSKKDSLQVDLKPFKKCESPSTFDDEDMSLEELCQLKYKVGLPADFVCLSPIPPSPPKKRLCRDSRKSWTLPNKDSKIKSLASVKSTDPNLHKLEFVSDLPLTEKFSCDKSSSQVITQKNSNETIVSTFPKVPLTNISMKEKAQKIAESELNSCSKILRNFSSKTSSGDKPNLPVQQTKANVASFLPVPISDTPPNCSSSNQEELTTSNSKLSKNPSKLITKDSVLPPKQSIQKLSSTKKEFVNSMKKSTVKTSISVPTQNRGQAKCKKKKKNKKNRILHGKQDVKPNQKQPPKKKKNRNKMKGKKVVLPNPVSLAFEGLQKMRETSLHSLQAENCLYDVLTDPVNVPNSATLLFFVIQFLLTSRYQSILWYVRTNGSSDLIPIEEHCIVRILLKIDESNKPHLQKLLVSAVNTLHQVILSKSRIMLYPLSSLCRVLTLICHHKQSPLKPLSLCCDLLKMKHKFAPYLIASVAGVWKDIFKVSDEMSNEEKIFHCAIAYGAQKNINFNVEQLRKSVEKFLKDFLSAPTVPNVDKIVEFLISKILKNCSKDLSPDLEYALTSPLIIFAVHGTWSWTKEFLLDKFVIPCLRKFGKTEVNVVAFNVFCNLYVEIFSMSPDGVNEEVLTSFFEEGNTPVHDVTAIALMKLHLLQKKLLPSALFEWCGKNQNNPMIPSIEVLLQRKVASDYYITLNDIIS